MTSYLLAGPATEPVSLAEAKAFLKIDDGAEDGLVTTLIGAARLHVEAVTGKALIAQSWRKVLDRWPAEGVVALPVAPVRALTAITATDDGGEEHALAVGQFATADDRVIVPRVVAGMPVLQERQGLEIDYVAGFGITAEAVPPDLKQAVLGLVAHWFEHRDAVVGAGTGTVVPSGFDRLVAAYKRVRL